MLLLALEALLALPLRINTQRRERVPWRTRARPEATAPTMNDTWRPGPFFSYMGLPPGATRRFMEPGPAVSPSKRMEQLSELLDGRFISPAEYEARKQALLDDIVAGRGEAPTAPRFRAGGGEAGGRGAPAGSLPFGLGASLPPEPPRSYVHLLGSTNGGGGAEAGVGEGGGPGEQVAAQPAGVSLRQDLDTLAALSQDRSMDHISVHSPDRAPDELAAFMASSPFQHSGGAGGDAGAGNSYDGLGAAEPLPVPSRAAPEPAQDSALASFMSEALGAAADQEVARVNAAGGADGAEASTPAASASGGSSGAVARFGRRSPTKPGQPALGRGSVGGRPEAPRAVSNPSWHGGGQISVGADPRLHQGGRLGGAHASCGRAISWLEGGHDRGGGRAFLCPRGPRAIPTPCRRPRPAQARSRRRTCTRRQTWGSPPPPRRCGRPRSTTAATASAARSCGAPACPVLWVRGASTVPPLPPPLRHCHLRLPAGVGPAVPEPGAPAGRPSEGG
jgi:hypothetical protein